MPRGATRGNTTTVQKQRQPGENVGKRLAVVSGKEQARQRRRVEDGGVGAAPRCPAHALERLGQGGVVTVVAVGTGVVSARMKGVLSGE